MCNYLGYKVGHEEYIRLMQIEKQFNSEIALQELRSGFVYGDWPTIVANAEKTDIEIKKMHWEYIPDFVFNMEDLKLIRKGVDPKTGARKAAIPWLNAKAENLLVNDKGRKAMWADSARKRRCLVIASQFFEWRHYKPAGAKKEMAYPYFIDFYKKNNPRYMAGIYNTWTDRTTGETIDTFVIVTTAANKKMAAIHNTKKRQPTILSEKLSWEWIMEDLSDDRILEIAKFQLPPDEMFEYTISKDFLSSEHPLAPFDYKELPKLVY